MTTTLTRASRRLAVLLALAGTSAFSPKLDAQAATPAAHEAAQHFERGVALYGEADYHGALVEFKRAYVLAPNPAVLYNIGETQYQLQDYAAALTSFRRYLAEAGRSAPHRAEVESSLEVLGARVGHVIITTEPPGADVTLDDQAVGRTPFEKAFLVSVGHRKIIAALPGRPPAVRYVDVAADDNITVSLPIPGATEVIASRGDALATPEPGSSGPTLRLIGWVGTGALAAGAVVFGVLGAQESSDLSTARSQYPVAKSTLDHDSSLTATYAALADVLAGSAIVLGGITLYSTLSAPGAPKTGGIHAVRVMLGPTSTRLQLTF